MQECDVVTERVFNARRESIFRAFSNPAVLARWWGPAGFSNTFKVFDFEPEGIWKFTMHGPDGVNYPNESVFREIVEPERIVFDHLGAHLFRSIFAFVEDGGRTLVHWTMRFPSADACASLRGFVTEANGQNLDRLEAQLARMNAN
jgi:uncharacterized protein YndB with AHSA1/START domain